MVQKTNSPIDEYAADRSPTESPLLICSVSHTLDSRVPYQAAQRGRLNVSRDRNATELTDRSEIERFRPFLSNGNRVSAPSRRQVSSASRRAGRCRMGL